MPDSTRRAAGGTRTQPWLTAWPKTDGSGQLDVPLLQRVAERLPSAPEAVATTVASLLTMADTLLSARDPGAGAGAGAGTGA